VSRDRTRANSGSVLHPERASGGARASAVPGKQTLVEQAGEHEPVPSPDPRRDAPVQFKRASASSDVVDLHAVARQGIQGAGESLPHFDALQAAFGRHDLSGVTAHVDETATKATRAIGADAYATGNHIAFASRPGLFTAAHEAVHIVQQRAGVQLAGGVGEAGDAYEQQADAVADRVVRGVPADDLLPPPGHAGATAVQRKARVSGMEWRNARSEGVNRIQDVVRAAQQAKKATIDLDLLIDPDFVGVQSHRESGTAPAGKEPDGIAIYKAAEEALSGLADEAPAVRKIMTVVLVRAPTGWQRSGFTQTGETRSLEDADLQQPDHAAWSIGTYLDLAYTAGRNELRLQVAMSEQGAKIVSWQAVGTAAKAASKPSSDAAEHAFQSLASTMQGRVLVYQVTAKLEARGWTQAGFDLLGEVKPIATPLDGPMQGPVVDESELVIEDVKAARRLVLTTAGKLIAEQDPTRFDNLIFSVGPFALAGVLKAGKLAKLGKLGKLAKVFGRPARRMFGEIEFRGLIKNRALRELTDTEITHAFSTTHFKLSNHANMRLRDPRTAAIGVETLDDVAKVLNDGIVQATKHADDANEVVEIAGRSMTAVVNVETNVIISFVPR
jgi:Domain of unknown function (DUF4157)